MGQPTALIFLNDQDRAAQAANCLAKVGVRAMTAASPRHVGVMYDTDKPDLLVVEGSLAPQPGLELVQWLRRGGVSCPVLFMCGSDVEVASHSGLHELRPFVACCTIDTGVVEYFLDETEVDVPPVEGNLEDTGLDTLFVHVLRTAWTGRLELACQGTVKVIYFEQGSPVYASSTLLSENFGQILLRRGVISEVEYEWARKLQMREGIRQGEALVKIGILSHEELFGYLREQIREKMVNAFGWPAADYTMDEGEHHLHNINRFRFNALRVVFDGQRNFTHHSDMLELWDEYRDSWGVLTCDRPEAIHALVDVFGFASLETLQQPQSVLRLASEQGWDRAHALSVFTTLHTNHMVKLARHPTALPVGVSLDVLAPDLPSVPDHTDAEHESCPQPDPHVVEMSESLWRDYLRITSADHFEALGVERDAAEVHLLDARNHMLERYAPMAFDPLLEQPQMVRAIQGIRTKVNVAFDTLVDPVLRSTYLDNLRESEENRQASQFLKAEDAFLTGMSKLPDAPEEARPHFALASQLNTLEPVYTMYYGWTRYLSAESNDEREEGRVLVAKALEANPLLDNGYVFMARMFADVGKVDEAITQAETALTFNPENVGARDIIARYGHGDPQTAMAVPTLDAP
ncbi:MAG: DUF4388 domain-containing protein [Myxococcota bacterium]